MKKLMILGLGLAMLNLTSCKKGENDPGLSLKGRKGRLAGTWNMKTSMSTETRTQDGNTDTEVWESTDGATYTSTDTDSDGNVSVSKGNTTQKVTFEKDGTFSMVMTRTQTSYKYGDSDEVTIDAADQRTYTTTTSGHWAFLGKNKDAEYKNKERVALTTTSDATTSSDSDENKWYSVWTGTGDQGVDMVMEIDMLKSKELGIKASNSSTNTPNDSDDKPVTWTEDEESTWEKE